MVKDPKLSIDIIFELRKEFYYLSLKYYDYHIRKKQ